MPRMFFELSEKNDIFLQETFLRDKLLLFALILQGFDF